MNPVIRKFRIEDAKEIAHLFYDTVHHVNCRHYTKDQLDAWAPDREDFRKWERKLQANLSFVAEWNNMIVGFGDITTTGYIDHLFVHKDYQRRGIASKIFEHMKKEMLKRGVKELTTEVSITARPFFEAKGFTCVKEQQKEHNGVVFLNYFMRFCLDEKNKDS